MLICQDPSSASVPISLNAIYDIIVQYIEIQKTNPKAVHMGAAAMLAYNNAFRFEMEKVTDETVITSLEFEGDMNKKLIYSFASEYDWGRFDNDAKGVR